MTKPIVEQTSVDNLLEKYGKTRKDVVETTGLPMSSLVSASKREFGKMTIKILQSIAVTVDRPLPDVVDELNQMEKR